MLHDRFNSTLDGDFEGNWIIQVLDDLFDVVSIKNHANDATCSGWIGGLYSREQMLAQELLLSFGSWDYFNSFSCDQGLLRHDDRHLLRDWHDRNRLLLDSDGLASQSWEG